MTNLNVMQSAFVTPTLLQIKLNLGDGGLLSIKDPEFLMKLEGKGGRAKIEKIAAVVANNAINDNSFPTDDEFSQIIKDCEDMLISSQSGWKEAYVLATFKRTPPLSVVLQLPTQKQAELLSQKKDWMHLTSVIEKKISAWIYSNKAAISVYYKGIEKQEVETGFKKLTRMTSL